MTDVHDKQTRSYNMSQIKGKNTKLEMLVRKFLFANEATLLIMAYFGKTSFCFTNWLKKFRIFNKIRRYGKE